MANIFVKPKSEKFHEITSNVDPQGMKNKAILETLYRELAHGHTNRVSELLASDLEWWFHGPPKCYHMMKVLTGESTQSLAAFRFEPRSITAFGDCIIAEGWEGAQAYWVHVWTLKGGVITQFREYFNTWLTVRDLRPHSLEHGQFYHHDNLSSSTVWQSQPRDLYRRSLPGLLLAI